MPFHSLNVESHFLVVSKASQPRAFLGTDVHEHIFAASFGLNETEAFGDVEPFHGVIGHFRGLLVSMMSVEVWHPGIVGLDPKTEAG